MIFCRYKTRYTPATHPLQNGKAFASLAAGSAEGADWVWRIAWVAPALSLPRRYARTREGRPLPLLSIVIAELFGGRPGPSYIV
jgi:hypothetical protein